MSRSFPKSSLALLVTVEISECGHVPSLACSMKTKGLGLFRFETSANRKQEPIIIIFYEQKSLLIVHNSFRYLVGIDRP